MAKYIAKISNQKGQLKITIPKKVVKLTNLFNFTYLSFRIAGRGKFIMEGVNVPDFKK